MTAVSTAGTAGIAGGRGRGMGAASSSGGLDPASACDPVAGFEAGLLRACFGSLPPELGVYFCLWVWKTETPPRWAIQRGRERGGHSARGAKTAIASRDEGGWPACSMVTV